MTTSDHRDGAPAAVATAAGDVADAQFRSTAVPERVRAIVAARIRAWQPVPRVVDPMFPRP
ncbi:hypothetical protein [Rhodococcus artemisiae]|jgi:hypothetical protein|uniref:Uncharacterized protein n=1 Tax=Rhodococcus artemisiae TaxID=714159 RepID=A0ABU7LJ69_9NOCA|nr:hypothetical protein [Rhodococcus artemisiae]MEE2061594.1 hypothetical protein [Rhodococcus artemisiae]